jgi:hypothetical protein
MAGCQSNAQHDLIAREIRMREDKIYAMEDYIEQYQQLLCKYRSENAELKRQMSDGYVIEQKATTGSSSNTPSTTPRNGESPSTGGPSIDVPPTPKANGSEPPPLDLPDVPALEDTNPGSAKLDFRPTNLNSGASEVDDGSQVVAASLETDSNSEASTTDGELILRGEVVANDSGGGPRIMVDVMTPSRPEATHATGQVSLIIAASSGAGPWRNYGRWDFGADDAELIFDETLHQSAMRFHLELPPEAPSDIPVELWARVISPDGTRLVCHVPINLQAAGQFTSMPVDEAVHFAAAESEPIADETPVDVVDRDAVQPASYTAPEPADGGWTIARPWEPGDSSVAKALGGEWRAATQTPPEVVASVPIDSLRTGTHRTSSPRKVWSDEPQPPSWSPDRLEKLSEDTSDPAEPAPNPLRSARPNWSSTR